MNKIRIVESDLVTLINTEISNHAFVRMRERGIDKRAVQMAILYGHATLKQGVTFYFMRKRDIPGYVSREEARQMENLLVIWSNDENEVVTCYHRSDGMRYVKRKTNRHIMRLDGRYRYVA